MPSPARSALATPEATRLVLVVGLAIFALVASIALLPLTATLPVLSALVAGLLYLLSHLLRAFRLAILSVDMLGVSGRTTVLMHFATAPISLALPLKLGELTRLYELWRLSGTFVYSIVVLLVDRMYDSLFLVPLLILLLMQGDASPALIVLTCTAAFVPLAVIVIGPRLMREVQRYVVAFHSDASTLATLKVIDTTRHIVTHAAGVARQQAPTLAMLSALIWLLEVLVCLKLISAVSGVLTGAFDLLGSRLTASWWTGGIDPLLQSVIALTLIATLLPWPLAIAAYFTRRLQATGGPLFREARHERANA